ncbi:MAG: GrpB family protein [Bacteroidia bacterium]
MRHEITIENYSKEWPLFFKKLKSAYENLLGDLVIEIHHVGSTSVEGLAAKPIIDIDLVIDLESKIEPVIEKLKKAGYTHIGNLGIVGREAFSHNSELTPEDGSNSQWPHHHVYLNLKNGVGLRNHLCVRDHLRAHPEKAKRYSQLKTNLAKEFNLNIDLYTEMKTGFIIEILREAAFDEETLKEIIEQNRAKKQVPEKQKQ